MRSYKRAGAVLTVWLAQQGITAAELSRRTGIDAGILRDILRGRKCTISTRNMMILAHYYGLTIKELIDHFA